MEQEKPHIFSIKSQIKILVILVVLTFLSIGVTKVDLGAFSLVAILILAAVQAYIVIAYHMHLKFESKFFKGMVISLFLLFIAVLVATIFDYIFR
ncbi:MAG TPA: cytochrome C oxidase subunit IV family protein [Bacteroidales bacterium]|nr:cytochrome C oxidase subunit IV family protein [Bacteroidales bacterium]